MKLKDLEKENNIEIEKSLINEQTQKNFLETTLGKTINTAIDIGIRAILPDYVENQVINIKDNLLEYGLKDGIKRTIDDSINIGKSAIGLFTGNFENINQMQYAIQSGGLIDGMSGLIDVVVDKVKKAGLINSNIARTIKQGKNIILNNIENNITDTFKKQNMSIENTDKYINNWKEYFNNKNFNGMEREYKKIEKQLKNIAPIEKTINEARKIEMLHNLIKNNGQNFELTQEQIELVEKFNN